MKHVKISPSLRWQVDYDDLDMNENNHQVEVNSGIKIDGARELSIIDVQEEGSKRKLKLGEIDAYCISRLMRLHGFEDKSNFKAIVGRGYYGFEVQEVEFLNNKEFISDAQTLLNMSDDVKKVMFTLEREYLVIDPNLEKIKSVSVERFRPIDVLPVSMHSMSIIRKDVSKRFSMDTKSIIGIVWKDGILLDGTHRTVTALMESKTKQRKYLVLS